MCLRSSDMIEHTRMPCVSWDGTKEERTVIYTRMPCKDLAEVADKRREVMSSCLQSDPLDHKHMYHSLAATG